MQGGAVNTYGTYFSTGSANSHFGRKMRWKFVSEMTRSASCRDMDPFSSVGGSDQEKGIPKPQREMTNSASCDMGSDDGGCNEGNTRLFGVVGFSDVNTHLECVHLYDGNIYKVLVQPAFACDHVFVDARGLLPDKSITTLGEARPSEQMMHGNSTPTFCC
jgi:hypothetical protein